MKRILAVIGVSGLALLGATAPAVAGDDEESDHKITICHATGSESNPYVSVTVDKHSLKGHLDEHGGDIIPWRQNWDDAGRAIFDNGCEPCPVPPVEEPEPPVVTPEEPPVVVPPVVTPEQPPVVVPPVVVPPVVAPIGAVVAPPAAPARVVNNPGFNVQTAVAPSSGPAIAPWAAGLAAMLLSVGGLAARRVLLAGRGSLASKV
ncbi:exported hypothetical protein [Arthrobacter sp. 9AX]|uniref:hypothetical protein n=1 Tax=Arthrobacter sp. 9AX TaxID=2653131 RepID=UPI0012F1CE82|nr:hypothetical protein [Arthrobacter sp. 9AX]VXB48875.1 exported hypothetical protein [Arthrobacter sp. 9AX]